MRWSSGMLRSADNGAGGSGAMHSNQSDSGTGGTGGADNGVSSDSGANGQTTPNFDSWYSGLDTATKGMVDGRLNNLESALRAERTERANERRNLSTQIANLQKAAEKGSDLEKQLTDLQTTLTATERRASFAEDAIRPEVGCTNVKAAYALAIAENLFDSRGRADWNAIKTAAPELFRRAGAGSADGGAGTGQGPKLDMNSIIRRAAGRG